MRRLAVVAALLWAAPVSAQAPAVAPGQVLSGAFTQERHLAGFDQPLRSTGRFALAPSRGLVWRVDTPFPSAMAITGTGLVQITGGRETRMTTAQVPFIGHVYDMMQGTLSGAWGVVESRFAVERRDVGQGWEATLTPRDDKQAAMSQITLIRVRGAAAIEEVEIVKAAGDRDRIAFHGTAVGGALAAEDADLLDKASR